MSSFTGMPPPITGHPSRATSSNAAKGGHGAHNCVHGPMRESASNASVSAPPSGVKCLAVHVLQG